LVTVPCRSAETPEFSDAISACINAAEADFAALAETVVGLKVAASGLNEILLSLRFGRSILKRFLDDEE
jgi:hypothetical protein